VSKSESLHRAGLGNEGDNTSMRMKLNKRSLACAEGVFECLCDCMLELGDDTVKGNIIYEKQS
jgi:hypothetical protein